MANTGKVAGDINCGRCGKKDPNHFEVNCPNEAKCSNCQENHPTFSRSYGVFLSEREIMDIKYRIVKLDVCIFAS